jgi:hypothetical protein
MLHGSKDVTGSEEDVKSVQKLPASQAGVELQALPHVSAHIRHD